MMVVAENVGVGVETANRIEAEVARIVQWASEGRITAAEAARRIEAAYAPALAALGVHRLKMPRENGPASIDLGDRVVHVLARMTHPSVAVIGGLLSPEECDTLIALARPHMRRSAVVSNDTGGSVIHDARTSDSMFWYRRGEHPVIAAIEARISRLLEWPVERGEPLQVLRYGVGAQYEPHYDFFPPEGPVADVHLPRGGQRIATVVMYLNTPEEGGATAFPQVGFEACPVRGNAVVFSYPSAAESSLTLHGGSPVAAGEKWIATKWLREDVFPCAEPAAASER